MSEELKPCPFCGQQDAFVEQLDSDASVVICQGMVDENSACLSRGPVGVQQSDMEDQPGREAAIAEWNRRAQPAEAEGVEVVAFQVRRTAWGTTSNLYTEKLPFVPGEGVTQYSEPAALIRQSDHLAALSAVTAERDRLQKKWARVESERDKLRAEVEGLRKDKARLDAIEQECWDVRFLSSPNGDAGDSSISIEIVGHFMAEPCERVVGENYHENLRAALDQAMTAETYPPARPEYDEWGRPVRAAMAAKGA